MLTQDATNIVDVPATLKNLRGLDKMKKGTTLDTNPLAVVMAHKHTITILKLLQVSPMRMKHIFQKIYHEDFTSNPSASSLMAYSLRELKYHKLIEGGRSKRSVGSWINNYSITEKGRHLLKKATILENFLSSSQDFMTYYESKQKMDSRA